MLRKSPFSGLVGEGGVNDAGVFIPFQGGKGSKDGWAIKTQNNTKR